MTIKGYHVGVWFLCWCGLLAFLYAVEQMLWRPVRRWGDHDDA